MIGVEKQYKKYVPVFFFSILVFLGAFVVILQTVRINVVVDTKGIVQPVNVYPIRFPVAVKIKAVLKSTGDMIKKGEPVIELESDYLENSISTQKNNYQNTLGRILTLYENSNTVMNDTQIKENNIRILEIQLRIIKNNMESARAVYESKKGLYEQIGTITQSEVNTAEKNFIQLQNEYNISSLQLENEKIKNSYNENIFPEFSEAQVNKSLLASQIDSVKEEIRYLETLITTLEQLLTNTIQMAEYPGTFSILNKYNSIDIAGKIIPANEVFFTISSTDFYIQGYVSNTDYPFFHEGDKIKVFVNAYSYDKFGYIESKITRISKIPMESNNSYYAYDSEITGSNDRITLYSGLMTSNKLELKKSRSLLLYMYYSIFGQDNGITDGKTGIAH